MKAIVKLIILGLFIAGWVLAAGALHVVRTPERIIVVPKNRMRPDDTYVDTRAWTPVDVANHPALIERLIHLGKAEALAHVVGGQDESDTVRKLSDVLIQGPQAVPMPTPAPEAQPTS